MAAKKFAIEHFDGSSSHGPVTLFVSDDGEMVLVCEQEGDAWRLSGTAERIDAARGGVDEPDGDELDRARRLELPALDVARRAFIQQPDS